MMGIRIPDHSRALIRERLTADPDSEIATTSLRVSLICPLGKMRLTLPCRAVTCSHLQCFDAALYLQMNEKKPKWKCPVCGRNAPYKSLFIDGLFMDVLNECSDADQIEFQTDGSWCPMRPTKAEVKVSSQSMPKPESSTPVHQCAVASQAAAEPGAAGKKVDLIDLTSLDDSMSADEETPAPPVKKRFLYMSKTEEIHSKGNGGGGREAGKEQKKEVLRCKICDVNLNPWVQVAKHNSGRTHRKNLLKLAEEMRPSPRTQEEVGLIVVVARRRGSKRLHCKACDKEFTFSNEEDHIDGQKHRKKLLRLRANKTSATAQHAMAMPKLSSGPYAIRIRSNRIDGGWWGEGSFDIFEKANKINLCIKSKNCGGPIKTFKLNQNVKHIAMNKNRIITLTLKDGAFINLDQMSAALTQKTKEYLEKVKQGKQDSRDCVEVVQPLPVLTSGPSDQLGCGRHRGPPSD